MVINRSKMMILILDITYLIFTHVGHKVIWTKTIWTNLFGLELIEPKVI